MVQDSGSEHNDDISEKYLLSVLALSIGWKMMLSPDLSGGNGLCLLLILASDLTILDHFPGGIDLFICDSIFFIEIIPEILFSSITKLRKFLYCCQWFGLFVFLAM